MKLRNKLKHENLLIIAQAKPYAAVNGLIIYHGELRFYELLLNLEIITYSNFHDIQKAGRHLFSTGI